MGSVRGKVVVFAAIAIVVANAALFFWVRESAPGCFLTKDEMAGRWGAEGSGSGAEASAAATLAFALAVPEARTKHVRGMLEDHGLYGKSAEEIIARLGTPDGASPSAGMPAYKLDAQGWSLVFVIGNAFGKTNIVRDIVVWRHSCP
ncbi:MAG: hypothetical protein IOD12_05225 [Silvanigrellales bacterium]|jgi:hypothetical protein|nr:hypothetical protein [Silvanigrellales bacterium]